MKQIAWIALALILGVSSVCHSANIKTGDSDYPIKNKNPNKFLSVKGNVSSALNVQLTAHFSPKDGGIYNPFTGGLVCGYMTGWGAYSPYMVDIPIPISRNETSYSASIPFDLFQEGKCGWHLFSLSYSVSNGKFETIDRYSMDLLRAWVDQSAGNLVGYKDFQSKLDKWCYVSVNGVDRSNGINKSFLNCEPSATNKLFDFVPAEKRKYYSQGLMKLEPQTIEINFNDLDAAAARE